MCRRGSARTRRARRNTCKVDLYTHIDSTSGTAALTGYFTGDATLTGDQTHTPRSSAVRALDTLSSIAHTNLTSTGTVAAGTNFTLQITGQNGVPSTATVVAVNLSAADATGRGYLQTYATGSPPPPTPASASTAATPSPHCRVTSPSAPSPSPSTAAPPPSSLTSPATTRPAPPARNSTPSTPPAWLTPAAESAEAPAPSPPTAPTR
ncbi:hypothetical protein QBA54_38145 [Streptomyces sp. B21-108]|uniref:hypothetical protein n=1 Tax=Streptomyces sp. B21-108 TaxID=3039419 RepID=UPI002FEEE963